MTRLPLMLIIALFSASAHESGGATSPPVPELMAASFSPEELPEVQVPPECPVANCLVDPVSLTREGKAPARAVSEFLATEGEEAELVVVTSNRRGTAVSAWLNGEAVLRPSAMPRAGTDEVRVPVTLVEQNVLEFGLSGKRETEVVFWVEGGDAAPPPPEDPEPTIEFRLSSVAVGPTAVMNAVCSGDHGENFEIAEWADVEAGTDPSPIHDARTAWIQRDGIGSFSPFPFGPTYHYLVSALGNLYPTYYYGTTGTAPNQFWLNAADGTRRVLCKGPAS